MHENLITNLTSKDDKYAYAIADKIIFESQEIGRASCRERV